MDLILDTSVWIAYLEQSDSQHRQALQLFALIDQKIWIPEYVLVEILNVLVAKVGKNTADEALSMFFQNQDIEIIWNSEEFRAELLGFFLSNKIEKLSFVDQSLLFMSKKYRVVTFDKELRKRMRDAG